MELKQCYWLLLLGLASIKAQQDYNDGYFGYGNFNPREGPAIEYEDGVVIPQVSTSRAGQEYYGYLGLPYAAPPVGDLRFRPPVKNSPFGYLKAVNFGPACAQYDLVTNGDYVGEEDCLYLNVFVPARFLGRYQLPVMVYLHGGAYMWASSANFGAEYFMDEPVIIVTLNFRVGILGFLNAGIPDAQGNMGLKDQVMALQWIQRNIGNFGGDPTQVTLFGDLSGGASTHHHMYNKMSKGLFSAAISMGGTALNPWAYQRRPIDNFYQLASLLGIDPHYHDRQSIVNELKRVEPRTLINSTINSFREWWIFPYSVFGPSVETVEHGYPRYLTEPPFMALQREPVNNVPWMVGVGDEMGLSTGLPILNNATRLQELNENWFELAPLMLFYRNTAVDSNVVSSLIRSEYFGNNRIDRTTNGKQLVDLNSDRLFYHGDRRSILSHLTYTQKQSQPVFLYQLSHRSNNSLVRNLGIPGLYGVAEMDDLQYLFTTPFSYYEYIGLDHPHYEFSANFVRLWVYFATYRNTQSPWSFQNKVTKIQWPEVDRQSTFKGATLKYLDINQLPSLIKEPFRIRADFWDSLPLMEYEAEIF